MTAELFARLELEPGASRDEIRSAYFRLAKTLHPDRQAGDDPEATERFLGVQRAYEILMDPSLALEYEKAQAKIEKDEGEEEAQNLDSRAFRPVMGGRPASGPSEEELRDAERA